MRACKLSHFSCVRFFATLWAVAHQAPLSMGFSRQEYLSGLLCPPPRDLPHSGIEPESLTSPALAVGFFTTSTTWEAYIYLHIYISFFRFFSMVVQMVKNPPAMQETQVQSLGREDPLQKGMVTHSSILAWRIPWIEEPAGHSPWGHKESDTTKQLTLSIIGYYMILSIVSRAIQ